MFETTTEWTSRVEFKPNTEYLRSLKMRNFGFNNFVEGR